MLKPQQEEKILAFWRKNNIFQKSLAQTKKGERFVFFEGPPTANGRPGIHHVLARSFKDLYPRFWTMRGRFVLRKAGWDTHGLPVELEVEKQLGLNSKTEIEAYGIARFNKKCKESVWRYKKEWEELTERIGFWLDLDEPYITYEPQYIESLWSIMQHVWQRGLFTKDLKIVPYCPRCGTGLSSHELAQGYRKVADPSLYLKLPVKNAERTYLILWTTTPWTLPGNVALAVNPKATYVKIKLENGECWYLAKNRLELVEDSYNVRAEVKGEKLIGLGYKHPYFVKELSSNAYRVYAGDFVSDKEGSGIVHIAPAYGEDDLELARAHQLPLVLHTNEDGLIIGQKILADGLELTPANIKPLPGAGQQTEKANSLIINDLQKRGLLVKQETVKHDYPFCWRCGTRLIYFVHKTWFIKMSKLRSEMLKRNQKINWVPGHIREGRFGEWLRELKDWAFSRDRYWGTPLPIWICAKCNHQTCIGSFKELLEQAKDKGLARAAQKDPHRPFIDKVLLNCQKCGQGMRREPYVVDVWFDSGSMPFAQWHYPFENKGVIDKHEQYPADFIAEGLDQTRGWFYTLLAVSTLYEKESAFKNVVSHGLVLDGKGHKMSKSKGNVVRPWEQIEKHGADAIRWYFYVVNEPAQAKRYDEKEILTHRRRFLDTLGHSLRFALLVSGDKKIKSAKAGPVMDRWLQSRLAWLIDYVTQKLEGYDSLRASRALEEFVDDLSNWYIRRSRERLKNDTAAQALLIGTLYQLLKLSAPFVPFAAEKLFQQIKPLLNLSTPESIHLASWPQASTAEQDAKLEQDMQLVRELASEAIALRRRAGLKTRQPLSKLTLFGIKLSKPLQAILAQEVNVKQIKLKKAMPPGEQRLELDTTLTPALLEEGAQRELLRAVQELRRRAGLKPGEPAVLYWEASGELAIFIKKQSSLLKRQATVSLKQGTPLPKITSTQIINLLGAKLQLAIISKLENLQKRI